MSRLRSPADGPLSLEVPSCSVEGFKPPSGEAHLPTPGTAIFFTPSRIQRGISSRNTLTHTAGLMLGWTSGQPMAQSSSPTDHHTARHIFEAVARR